MTANSKLPNSLVASVLMNQPNAINRMPMPPTSLPRVPLPVPQAPIQQVADADAMKASFERTLQVLQASPRGSDAWNQRAAVINDMSQRIFDKTGEIYSQGQWVKVPK